eukprot:scaffold1288_cov35-Phaeocystis_antarctica.AAC.1
MSQDRNTLGATGARTTTGAHIATYLETLSRDACLPMCARPHAATSATSPNGCTTAISAFGPKGLLFCSSYEQNMVWSERTSCSPQSR